MDIVQYVIVGIVSWAEGVRNISNELSIGSNITMSSAGLQDYAKERRWWDGTSPFSFKQAFSSDTSMLDMSLKG